MKIISHLKNISRFTLEIKKYNLNMCCSCCRKIIKGENRILIICNSDKPDKKSFLCHNCGNIIINEIKEIYSNDIKVSKDFLESLIKLGNYLNLNEGKLHAGKTLQSKRTSRRK